MLIREAVSAMKGYHHISPTFQFALPVILESVLSTFINLVFSSLIGGISGSSLTTISQCNLAITLITAASMMLTTGSGILCARLLGGGEMREASRIVEQTLFLSLVSSLVITGVCLVFTQPLMAILMPNAQSDVLSEGVAYFRVLILSLPFLMLTSTLVSVLRASGDSRSPMFINVFTCVLQLLFAFLLLRVLALDIIGAGLTFLLCRLGGALLAFYVLLHSHRYAALSLRKALHPHLPTFRRILAVGVPTSVESIFVQAGYLMGSSMVIGLGTFEAAVYNVANTLYSFASLPQGILSTIALTISGQLIGAKAYAQAKKTGWHIWMTGMASMLAMSIILLLARTHLTPLYSADPAVQSAAADAILFALLMNPPGTSLNTLDPQLRAGGDVKFVMTTTIIAVWLIRLPLTYLFCYHWTWGASGVFLANAISLFFRMVCNMARFIQGKYLYMRV